MIPFALNPATAAAVAVIWGGAYLVTGALHTLWFWRAGTQSSLRPVFDALATIILALPLWKQAKVFAQVSLLWLLIEVKAGGPTWPLVSVTVFLLLASAGTVAAL